MNQTELILYTTTEGKVKVNAIVKNETIFCTQTQVTELFNVKLPAVTNHLKNIFENSKIDERVVVSILEHTTQNSLTISKMETVHQDEY